MSELQRITTEFVDIEDRIRLSGQATTDQVVMIWLTQRLLGRLIPHLLGWLEKKSAVDARLVEVVQGFAQQAARAYLAPQAPVQCQVDTCAWLVLSVDVVSAEEVLQLVFKGADDLSVSLSLGAQALRQWLNILHDQYRVAEWPLHLWPQWMMPEQFSMPADVRMH